MLYRFWKVLYSFAVKCCAGVIRYRLSPTLKSCKENHSAEERKETKKGRGKKTPKQQTPPNTDYASLENIALTICEQQKNTTTKHISHLLEQRKRTFNYAYPAIGGTSNTDFYLVSISLRTPLLSPEHFNSKPGSLCVGKIKKKKRKVSLPGGCKGTPGSFVK